MRKVSRKWVWIIGIVIIILVVLSGVLYVSTTPVNIGPANIDCNYYCNYIRPPPVPPCINGTTIINGTGAYPNCQCSSKCIPTELLNGTCNQKCKNIGYVSGICKSGPGVVVDCGTNFISIGPTSDCQSNEEVGGSWKTCCCESVNLTSLITDKNIYNKDENISMIFNPGNEDVYIQKNVFNGSILLSTEFEVYRLQNNEWIKLRLDTYCGNVMSCGEYGLISLPCPAPPQPECNKITNKITWVWNQKVWEYITRTCVNTAYTSEELKQVDAGTYKIRVNYYNSNYCNDTQKYVETQFEIKA